jgi:hypothetical protein
MYFVAIFLKKARSAVKLPGLLADFGYNWLQNLLDVDFFCAATSCTMP